MEVNCEGCAGCCVDWRPLHPDASDHERRGGRRPLDDAYNLVPLTRDEVREFCDAGLGDALVPRLWTATERDDAVTVDGVAVAAADGRPVFVVGLRSAPKPVAPFGVAPAWLRTCVFLDPGTLRCRVHGDDLYPETCATYPGSNLRVGSETECERVEAAFGGDRLVDDAPPPDATPRFGPQARGSTVFAHPDPARLDGVVDRLRRGASTPADRAEFVGVAVGSRPGSFAVDADRAATWRERALAADSWVGRSVDAWAAAAAGVGSRVRDAPGADDVETSRGAPPTDGWESDNG